MPFSESERIEVKFALLRADLGKLESILEVNCRRVSYRNRTSRVVSLYFDDHGLSACRDNVDGSSRRAKLRLRWYDDPFPPGDLFLEIKRRRGQATRKERHPLTLTRPLESVSIRETAKSLSRALPEAASEALLARPEAIVIVEYERSYFEAPFEALGTLRFTLDRNLVFYFRWEVFARAGGFRFTRETW